MGKHGKRNPAHPGEDPGAKESVDPYTGRASVLCNPTGQEAKEKPPESLEAFRLLSEPAPPSTDRQSPAAAINSPPPSAAAPTEVSPTQVAPPKASFGLSLVFRSALRALAGDRRPQQETSAATPSPTPDSQTATPDSTTHPAGLSGHTSTVAIPEVLGFLAQLRKSGTLWIWNDEQRFLVQLVDGNVTFARNETMAAGSRIGEILITQGAIDAAGLEEFMREPRAPGPLGDALVQAGRISEKTLSKAVQCQA